MSLSAPYSEASLLLPPNGRPRRQLRRDHLTAADVEALLAACSNRAPTGIRNRALIAVLWRCGLRISEALDLRPTDIDLGEGVLHVRRGKGGRSRVVGIDAGTAALIERWMEVRRNKLGRRDAVLFSTLAGGRIDASYIRRLLPRLARRAGVERRVHAHGLRHRHALDLAREGASLPTIRDLLGHANASTTDAYLRRVGGGDAVQFGRAREWPPETINGRSGLRQAASDNDVS